MNTAKPLVAATTTLYYREGGSDKVYTAYIIQDAMGLYRVNIAFGRRGSTMQTGTKTQTPVTEKEAHNIMEKVLNEKRAKGYVEGEDGTPMHKPDAAVSQDNDTRILPMLLNPITQKEAKVYIENKDWCMQQKYDGERRMVMKSRIGAVETIYGINRKGCFVDLPESIHNAMVELDCDGCLLDGEIIGDELFVFDVLEVDEGRRHDLRSEPYRKRLITAQILCEKAERPIRFVETASSTKGKRELLPLLRKHLAEGVVFKRLDAPYTAGRPNSGGNALKCKFYETASFIVGRGREGKRSISLMLVPAPGAEWLDVGNCTIPPNFQVPEPGAIVEVRYLYAFKGGSVYQPVYLGERDDIHGCECTPDQLKYKGEPS